MEPSAKCMRIWQSVEVDEENVEYIKAKQKQQQKFKGRLESIFEKYGNMHESMSDEIDMKTNRVVVDRGHLRRLKRQVGRKETMLLDTLGLAVEKEPEQGSEDEGNREDSEDELAPTQPAKSNEQPELDGQEPRVQDHDAQSPRSDNVSSVPQPTNDSVTSIPHVGTMQTPNTPNPTSNLLPLVQFPQTPAGQQAQTTFYLTLTQGISEVIQKAMAQSGLLPPNFPSPFANAAPLPSTPITTADRIAPATDPKWFFPPLSATRQDRVAQSSPLPAGPPAGQATLPYEPEGQILADSTPLVNEASPMVSQAMLEASSPTRCRRTSPRVEIQKRRIRPARKYQFTADDDAYISKRKMVDRLPWAAIKESQKKWKDWPLNALSRRWAVIKDQNLHLQAPVSARSDEDVEDVVHELEEQAQTLAQSRHLPTPISSEQEDVEKEEELTENVNGFPSSAYFDDDERELLSLAGTDVEDQDEDQEEDQNQNQDGDNQDHVSGDEEAADPVSEDSIIPSVETPDLPIEETPGLIDEDDLQRELLENLPMRDATISPPRHPSVQVKTEPASPSPIITQTEDALSRRFEIVPDSDSVEDTTNDSTPHQPTPPSSFSCPICDRAFESLQTLARHTANPRNTHTHPASAPTRKKSLSLDLIAGDDDLLPVPMTPVKQEFSTPSSTSFFVSGFQTPKVAVRQRGSSFVEGERGTEKSERMSVKQLKRCWKGNGTPVASAKKRKRGRESLGVMVGRSGKKVKMGVRERESEERDELCF
ncbi:hypothetical protein yc1106_04241 [Curvularia clavata]|uniref:C2H2-type domain-containing protein n=1 Tax=Curvularia clavata TaxID=95742 RepID=A0A9Q8Z7C5_CURCL|nr:hypothetical protein yc1106_04241 [Curvularia clavata]